ncbi:DNA polymerase III subunit gamma/tau, partial [Patescibacteria group bacterium]|nr:DNA polymerase III subunit gamma/tau [Patescibacteria group bacterium]
MAVLYRKYRPKLWSEVYGQDSIKNVLLSEIKQDKIANCYIFSGPRGIGKTTIARLMAKSLNCLDRKENGEPCLACKNCLEFSDSSGESSLSKNMNVIELDAASNRGVDDTNEFLENVNIPPIGAKYKVFIIDEVHMFSKHSFNRLLKTFEEPPKGVVFILATTEFNKIPDTIISRAEVFKFKKGNKASLSSDLKGICEKEGVSIDDEVLDFIISKSSGCFRDAETLLGQVISSGSSDIKLSDVSWLSSGLENLIFDFTEGLVKKDLKYLISFISNLSTSDISYPDFSAELIEFLRKIMIYSIDSSVSEEWSLSDAYISQILEFSQKFERGFLIKAIDEFIECKLRMNVFEIKNLALELSVIKLCGDDGIVQKNDDMGTHHGASVHVDNLKNNENIQNKSIPLKNEN